MSEDTEDYMSYRVPLNQAAHKVNKGCACPTCGWQALQIDEITLKEWGAVRAAMRCSRCNSTWTDEFELARYVNLVDGRAKPEEAT